ncbi:flavin reductase family protein [Bacillus niameyensis]|uniref:flavin reductase family protein n=1 Tax=Bacillus niameyensis TaxID=1522308 RepID=UPI0007837BED|nr:flavin reductase family protein [Bacillus niameyensis]
MENNISLFRKVMGNYPSGVTVVTTINENNVPLGLTVNSFSSVSLEPLLILWSIDKKVSSYDVFMKTGKFAINILSSKQADICALFARKGNDRFQNCQWESSSLNLPIISGAASVLQCRTYKTVEAGDHTIFIGEVIDIHHENIAPLLYHKREMGEIPKSFYSSK